LEASQPPTAISSAFSGKRPKTSSLLAVALLVVGCWNTSAAGRLVPPQPEAANLTHLVIAAFCRPNYCKSRPLTPEISAIYALNANNGTLFAIFRQKGKVLNKEKTKK
jgi:hypothetical protein